MSRFEDLLHDVADGPVRFDHRDIARRVRHRRHSRLVAVAAIVVLGFVGLVAGLGDDRQEVDAVGPVEGGAVTVAELVEDRWVASAYSAVMVPPSPPAFLQFRADGGLDGFDGCGPINGDWKLDGARMTASLEPMGNPLCDDQTGGLTELLQSDLEVSRFDGTHGTLQLTSGEDFVAFERFDRLGDEPTTGLLEERRYTYAATTEGAQAAAAVTFETNGTGTLEMSSCSSPFAWSLEGDVLDVDGLDRNGVPCEGGTVGGGLLLWLTSSPRLRLQGSSLWLSSDLGVDLLRSTGAESDPSSEGASICGPYVEYLATGWHFTSTLTAIESASSSAPPNVVSSVGAILSAAERGERSDPADEEALKSWALEECSAVYKQGTTPLSTDEEAAQALFDAVIAGDQARAHQVATANAVAVFAPWGPLEAGSGLPRLVDEGDMFRLDLTPDVSFRCRAESGLVVDCALQE